MVYWQIMQTPLTPTKLIKLWILIVCFVCLYYNTTFICVTCTGIYFTQLSHCLNSTITNSYLLIHAFEYSHTSITEFWQWLIDGCTLNIHVKIHLKIHLLFWFLREWLTFKGINSVKLFYPSLVKRVCFKRKEFAPSGSKFFPFREDLFSEGN